MKLPARIGTADSSSIFDADGKYVTQCDTPAAAADLVAGLNEPLDFLKRACNLGRIVPSSELTELQISEACRFGREDDSCEITEEWLRSVGFKWHKSNGEQRLIILMTCHLGDRQWLETGPASCSHGFFMLCRLPDTYIEDDVPEDRVAVCAKTRGQLRALAAALAIPLHERSKT